ncbi:MAG: TolC family protein [Pirellulales bacterium]
MQTPLPPQRLPPIEHSSNVQLAAAVEELPQNPTGNGPTEPVLAGQPEKLLSGDVARPIRIALFDAIETSLMQNPDLTALRRNEGVSVGALGVAQTYPFNPYVQVQVTPFQHVPVIGSRATAHYVLVMQTIQLAHQQRHRESMALAALQSVRWNILQAELLNIALTERLYFTAQYLKGVRDLQFANAEVNRQLLSVVEKQLAAGDATGADAAIARLDNQSARQQAELADANYQAALLDLRRQLNLPLEIPCELAGGLEDIHWASAAGDNLLRMKCGLFAVDSTDSGPLPAIGQSPLADLVAGRPDVLAAHADLAAANANASLANASRVPDLQVGPYYARNEGNATFVGLRAQMDVPVWNTGTPLLRQRQAESRQRRAVWEQLHARAQIEAQTAIDRYERARRLVAAGRQAQGESLPTALARLEEQFRAGDIDIIRVVTARTSLLQVRRVALDSLNELAQSAAAVTAATGIRPELLFSTGPPMR